MANKVLNLEKDLQTEKRRRLEAEKKLLDASASGSDSRSYLGQSLSEQEDLQRVKEHLNTVTSRVKNSLQRS